MPYEPPPTPFVDSVLFPSDFSPDSETAFAHALAIALLRKTRLTLLHVGSGDGPQDDWRRFPGVRSTLERWGVLEPGSERAAVMDQLSVDVTKVGMRGGSPRRATLEFLERHPADLLVLATEGREGLQRWRRPSVAEGLARSAKALTLFVPKGGRGFVAAESGELLLRRILVAADRHPDPHAALVYAARAGVVLGEPTVEIGVVHVGEEPLRVDPPQVEGVSWKSLQRSGDVVEEIGRAAEEHGADLVVMATHGHDGVLDVLRGSVTEQVMRRSDVPLLAVPAP